MARLWLVRLGKNSQYEALALEENLLAIKFGLTGDISHLVNRDALIKEMARLYPGVSSAAHRNYAAQINQFINTAQVGDLVISPIKSTSTISIGRISGPCRSAPEGLTVRPVQWLRKDLPRAALQQDLLFSLGAIMTVCEISRNDAVSRVEKIIETGRDPGDGAQRAVRRGNGPEIGEEVADQPISLDDIARDQIVKRIASVFTGHDFTQLVAAILTAQGYKTRVSPPGADRGVDIVAGSGPLGLESPRLVVQVKSGGQVVDQPTLQGLIGSIQDTAADYGLIVSWSGFTAAVRNRTNDLYFRVRQWGRDEILENLLSVYDRLPETIRADLPLQKTWTLVIETDEFR